MMKHLSVPRFSVHAVVLLQIDLESGIILMVVMFDLLVVVIPSIEVEWMMEQYDCIGDQVAHYHPVEDTNVQSQAVTDT